jgi:hypothetical protein
MLDLKERIIDPATQKMMEKAAAEKVNTAFDRAEERERVLYNMAMRRELDAV